MQRRRVGNRVHAGRTGGGGRRGRPAPGSRRPCRANVMPRGISSLRNRPITSPWPSVLTSSPGMTIRSRSRASSTASSAPPKTLWSVTAIAPRPSASAWSSRSSTGIEQSRDQEVCMWRSPTIQSRSRERVGRSARAAAGGARDARVELVELGGRRPRTLWPSALRLASSARRSRERLVLGEPGERGGGELGLLVDAGRRRRSRRRPRRPRARRGRARRAAGTKIAASSRMRRAGRAVAGGPHADPAAQLRAGSPGGRPAASSAGSTSSQSGSSRSARSDGARERALGRAPLERRRASASRAGRKSSGSTPAETIR